MSALCVRLRRAGSTFVATALLVACASAPMSPAMQAAAPPPARATAPGPVSVLVTGGGETTALDGPNIANADFKAAIEASLLRARAFERAAVDADARYMLSANIVSLAKPLIGFSYTVELEVGWSLLDKRSGQVLLRKSITVRGTATMAEAFAGATRIRLAVEAAARANIEQMLRELPDLN
jgi:hypothetical protein